MDSMPTPIIDLLPSGGVRVTMNGVSGTGATVADALTGVSEATAKTYDAEKGDESLAAQTAARQTDILANDRAIIGNQIQNNLVLGLGIGMGFGLG